MRDLFPNGLNLPDVSYKLKYGRFHLQDLKQTGHGRARYQHFFSYLKWAALLLALSLLAHFAQAQQATAKATPILTLSSPSTFLNPSSVQATLTAQLTASTGVPTGQIVFSAAGSTLGTAAVSPTGSAVLMLATLPGGVTSITASYSGDGNFNPAISAPVPVLTINTGDNALVYPYTLTFPSQAVGTSSAPQLVTLGYVQAGDLTINSITLFGDFTGTNNCGSSLTGGYECLIEVSFSPQKAETATGALTISYGSGSTAGSQTVSLYGTTLPPTIGVTSSAILSSGTAGDYTLIGTIFSAGGNGASPAGQVSFFDQANPASPVATASFGASVPGLQLGVLSPLPTVPGPNALVTGDFNEDGKLDIATANGGAPGYRIYGGPPTILLGNGDGTFTVSTAPTTAVNPTLLATGDFNGDGKLDLAVDGGTGGALILLFGNGDGTFTASSTQLTSYDPSGVMAGDFNGDGKLDLAVGNGITNTVTVLLGDGTGAFTAGMSYPTGQYPNSIVTADFNHDGKLDMAVGSLSDGGVTILLGVGDGTFTASQGPAVNPFGSSLVVGDFNGDGKPDLAASGHDNSGNGALNLFVLLGNGDGTFQMMTSTANNDMTRTVTLAGADFDGDGKTDLVLAEDQNVSILLSNGDGTFRFSTSTPGATSFPDSFPVISGDFNGDGVPDSATADSDTNTVGINLTQHTQTAVATVSGVLIPGGGTRNIYAQYPGDANHTASSSQTVALTGSQVPTTLALASSTGSSTLGAQLVFTATLAPYASGNLATNGETVTFYDNGASIGTAVLTSGVASLNITTLPVGNHSITAAFAGDANFAAASAPAISVAVTAPTAAAVTLSPASLTFPSEAVGIASATQAITLTNTGQLPLTITSVAASGDFAATSNCGTSVAPGASCTIAVTFTPTATGARTGSLTITDNAANSPQTVALSGQGAAAITASFSSISLSIASAGGSATATIQLSAGAGFSGAANLTCAVTYQGTGTPVDAPTCSLNPTQVQLSGSAPVSSVLTVSSTAATASLDRRSGATLDSKNGATLAALAGLLLFGLVPRRYRGRKILLVALCGVALGGILGCGGGGSGSSQNGGSSNPGTTTGNYQVAVTASSGSATVTTTIPLSVQ